MNFNDFLNRHKFSHYLGILEKKCARTLAIQEILKTRYVSLNSSLNYKDQVNFQIWATERLSASSLYIKNLRLIRKNHWLWKYRGKGRRDRYINQKYKK